MHAAKAEDTARRVMSSVCTRCVRRGGREYLLAGLDRRNRFGCFGCTPIKLGVEGVIVTRVQMLLHHAQRIAEALEVYDFAFPQEFQRVAHIGVINQTKQIVIGCACLLFCCKRARAAY